MPDTLKDPGSRETTEPSRFRRLSQRMGAVFFPFRKDRETYSGLGSVIDETMERKALAAVAMERGYRPGTIEHPEMLPGGAKP